MATSDYKAPHQHTEDFINIKRLKFGIVVSEWNADITNNLFKGAKDTLLKHGVLAHNILRYSVPGSFELVFASQKMQRQGVDAVIAIGSVIEGETKHFDYVCQGVTQGITQLNCKGVIPVIFCVLTDHNKQQALDRSGGKLGNKGEEAAIAAIKMARLASED